MRMRSSRKRGVAETPAWFVIPNKLEERRAMFQQQQKVRPLGRGKGREEEQLRTGSRTGSRCRSRRRPTAG
eukprot:724840-Hanusia_phi.AAC.2